MEYPTLKYINTQNKTIDLRGRYSLIKDANFHDYAWDPNITGRRVGSKLNYFGRDTLRYTLTVWIKGSEERKKKMLDDMTDYLDYDVKVGMPGKLYYGEYYLRCFAVSTQTAPNQNNETEKTIEILGIDGNWIKEETKHFYNFGTQLQGQNKYKLYDYTYNVTYAQTDSNTAILNNKSANPSEFKMVINGFVDNPRIYIGEYVYGFDVTVDRGEYIILDSTIPSAVLHKADGTIQNVFGNRTLENYIYEPVVSGEQLAEWDGDFAWSITLYDLRSEPRFWQRRV